MFPHRAPGPRTLDRATDDASGLAIRHPSARDGDALAAGLELACRVLGGRAPLGDLRLDHNTLNTAMVAVRSGRCDRAMVRSLRDQIAELRVALTPHEHDAVATVIAAVIWAVLDASARALDDTLVA
jgi:hypothetical protein